MDVVADNTLRLRLLIHYLEELLSSLELLCLRGLILADLIRSLAIDHSLVSLLVLLAIRNLALPSL